MLYVSKNYILNRIDQMLSNNEVTGAIRTELQKMARDVINRSGEKLKKDEVTTLKSTMTLEGHIIFEYCARCNRVVGSGDTYCSGCGRKIKRR